MKNKGNAARKGAIVFMIAAIISAAMGIALMAKTAIEAEAVEAQPQAVTIRMAKKVQQPQGGDTEEWGIGSAELVITEK